MSKTHDIIDGNTASLRSIAYRLDGLASAFDRIGNEKVAEELFTMSSSIADLTQEIQEAYRENRMARVDQDLANSQRFIGSILSGLINGKDPKDACIDAMPHHFDRSIIEAQDGAA